MPPITKSETGVPDLMILSKIPSLAELDDICTFELVFLGLSSGRGFDIGVILRVSVITSDIGVPLCGFMPLAYALSPLFPEITLSVPIMASDTGYPPVNRPLFYLYVCAIELSTAFHASWVAALLLFSLTALTYS